MSQMIAPWHVVVGSIHQPLPMGLLTILTGIGWLKHVEATVMQNLAHQGLVFCTPISFAPWHFEELCGPCRFTLHLPGLETNGQETGTHRYYISFQGAVALAKHKFAEVDGIHSSQQQVSVTWHRFGLEASLTTLTVRIGSSPPAR